MTEKRYSYDSKQVAILKDGEFWLEGQIDTACNHSEICNELNQLSEENEQLKESNERFSKTVAEQIIMIKEYREENEKLKQVLGAILLEVKRDITNINQTGEMRVFINPNSFNLISEVLRKYGVLKEWYE